MRHLLALAAAVLLAGCSSGGSGAGSQSGTPARKFAMVTDVGGLGDKSFNDSANRGLQIAQKQFGAQVTVLQSRAVTDYEPNLSTLAEQGNGLIFAIGFLMHDSLNDVAPRFPNTHFAIVDSVVDQPNVTSITFKEEESSFLAGVIAGLTTKKATVAFLGGIESPLIEKFQAGFAAGVVSVNPRVAVLVKYTGSFDDVATGKEYASVLYDQGADIIYVAAGKCGLGAIDEARSRPAGDYIIGVDSDQDALAPGKVLTSALKHVDNAVLALAKDAVRGTIPGGTLVFGLKDGGVGLTEMKYSKQLLPKGALATEAAYEKLIVSGKLVIPSTLAQLKTFVPLHPAATR
ncbi:MAG TPA: BMP family ABC transporter substrate-binding protein [Candidatus Eremiobacteraceae bacterium]